MVLIGDEMSPRSRAGDDMNPDVLAQLSLLGEQFVARLRSVQLNLQ
jgi:hypothetical protein